MAPPCPQMTVLCMVIQFFPSTEAANKKAKGSSQIQRSQETGMAVEYPRNAMARQASRESTDGSMNSYSSEGKLVSSAV